MKIYIGQKKYEPRPHPQSISTNENENRLHVRNFGNKRKASGSLVSNIISTSFAILVIALMASFFLLTIPAFYKYTGVLIPTLFTLLLITVVFIIATRMLRKRLKLERKLKKLCRNKGYIIERNIGFFSSLKFVTSGYHYIIETPKVRFAVRYMTFKKRLSKVTFRSNQEVDIIVNMNASRNLWKSLLGIKEKTVAYHFDFDETFYDKDKRVEKIVLMNPVPSEVNFINKEGIFTPTGPGQEMYGFVIYNGSGFLSMLDQLDGDIL